MTKQKSYEKNLIIFTNPTGIYLLEVNNRNTKTRCEICSKLTIKLALNNIIKKETDYYQGLNRKEIQLNLRSIFSILIFNELFLFAL